ncbi:MAG: hypothetical protein F4X64_10625 [Chloroflexi bacterium]|nr:hypothetical protein [Chloroflexota bacterium]
MTFAKWVALYVAILTLLGIACHHLPTPINTWAVVAIVGLLIAALHGIFIPDVINWFRFAFKCVRMAIKWARIALNWLFTQLWAKVKGRRKLEEAPPFNREV